MRELRENSRTVSLMYIMLYRPRSFSTIVGSETLVPHMHNQVWMDLEVPRPRLNASHQLRFHLDPRLLALTADSATVYSKYCTRL